MSYDTSTKIVSLADFRKRKRQREGRDPLPKNRSLVIADHKQDRFIFTDEPIPESYFPEPRA